MKDLKEFIEKERGAFENEELPFGHKERFLAKLNRKDYGRVAIYLAAASVLALLIITPIYFQQDGKINCNDKISDYKVFLNDKSSKIYLMAGKLDEMKKSIIINTLDEILNETVPFEDQIPAEIDEVSKAQLKQQYYCPKIEGLERLGNYVAQLINK